MFRRRFFSTISKNGYIYPSQPLVKRYDTTENLFRYVTQYEQVPNHLASRANNISKYKALKLGRTYDNMQCDLVAMKSWLNDYQSILNDNDVLYKKIGQL